MGSASTGFARLDSDPSIAFAVSDREAASFLAQATGQAAAICLAAAFAQEVVSVQEVASVRAVDFVQAAAFCLGAVFIRGAASVAECVSAVAGVLVACIAEPFAHPLSPPWSLERKSLFSLGRGNS